MNAALSDSAGRAEERDARARRVAEFVAAAAGAVSLLLGAVVMAGWHTHNVTLIQVNPAFVPMQYNTAFGFVLCGTAMVCVAFGWCRLAVLFGTIAGTVGALTLIEYLFGVSLGIDELLMEHYVAALTPQTGRMAPNTALCFLLSGTALCAAGRFRRRFVLLTGAGSLVFALGAMAVIGYLSGTPTAYSWGSLTGMAVHTAAGFSVLGAGLLLLAWTRRAPPAVASVGDANRQRIRVVLRSVAIMMVVAIGVQLVAVRELRHATIEKDRSHLAAIAAAWRDMVIADETPDRLDAALSRQGAARGVARKSRGVAAGSELLATIGESGEIVLARRQGDEIVFLVHRQQPLASEQVQAIPLGTDRAEPMRRAITGEAGTVIGLDYTGELVVAAYLPLGQGDWGLVAKVDLVEVEAPFVAASLLATGFSLVLVTMGALALLLTIDPTIRGLADRTDELQIEVTERKVVEEELLESGERRRLLAERLQTVREEERRMLARELHDELGQALTCMRMDTVWTRDRLVENQEPLRARLRAVLSLIDETILTVRRVSTRLRPTLLDDLGLGAAIEWHTQQYAERTGIECVLDLHGDTSALTEDGTTAVFRIMEEALTNVARHAEASRLQISTTVNNGELLMRILDDGKGFDPAQTDNRQSIGLIGMQERAEALGGRVEFTRPPDGGTEVVVVVPLPAKTGEIAT